MFKKKILATLAVTALTIAMSTTALAAALEVKSDSIKDSGVEVKFPQIKGARGGATVDNKVNMQILGNVWNGLMSVVVNKPLTPVADEAAMVSTFGTVEEAKASTKQIGSYLGRRLKMDRERVGQKTPYYVHMNYDVKSSPAYDNTLISVVQEVNVYTGGAHSNTHYVPVNYDLRTGKLLTLKDMFEENSDYQGRLLQLMKIQAKGQQRITNKVIEATKVEAQPEGYYVPKAVTGNEKFYVNARVGTLTVFYNPGEIAPISEGQKSFEFGLDTIADIIKLGK